jgi:antibiotic biosynthesis monooxygenase (ABM) superfamily enzyme
MADDLVGDPADDAIRSDPLLAYIPREETSQAFWAFPQQERSKRARFMIVVRCAGMDSFTAWLMTMDVSPKGQAFIDEIVAEKQAMAQERNQSFDQWLMDAIRVDGGWITDG